jgi:hypothetical protein
MDLLAQKVREIGDVVMIVIDPITAYLGSEIDSHRISDVRAALLPLEEFAEEVGVCVLGICHPPKSPAAKALHYIAGSGAFVHAPRLVFMAIEDPEQKGRNLVLAVKNNLGRKADGLGYSIVGAFVGPEESISTSRIHWDDMPVRMTADEVLEKRAEKNKAKSKAEAESFLRDRMQPGQTYAASDLQSEAAGAGINERTLRRAGDDIGVKKSKDGFGGKVRWTL